MSKLQKARERLIELRDNAHYGPWLVVDKEDSTAYRPSTAEVYGAYGTIVGAGDYASSESRFDADTAELIVALHRTIDAQIAMLDLAIEYGNLRQGKGSRFIKEAKKLARAILDA